MAAKKKPPRRAHTRTRVLNIGEPRPGIDDDPSPQTRAICGDHIGFIIELSRALGETRATILRSIVDEWTNTPAGRKGRLVAAAYRRLVASNERLIEQVKDAQRRAKTPAK